MASRSTVLLVVACTFIGLSTLIIIARVISKWIIVRRPTRDDYVILAAWLTAVGLTICVGYGTSVGMGKHAWQVAADDVLPLRKCLWAFLVLYNPAIMLTKVSILLFYLRLSKNTQKALRVASFVTMAIVVVVGTIMTFLNIFQCRPIRLLFTADSAGQLKCFGPMTLSLAAAPANLITDLALLLIPLPTLTSLHLPWKQKVILVLTFLTGIFVTVIDVIRVYYLQEAALDSAGTISDSNLHLNQMEDFAYLAAYAYLWSMIEVNVGIICASVPSIKPLINKVIPRLINNGTRLTTFTSSRGPRESKPRSRSFAEIGGFRATRQDSDGLPPLPPMLAQYGDEVSMMNHHENGPGSSADNSYNTGTGSKPSETRMQKMLSRRHFNFIDFSGPSCMLDLDVSQSLKYGCIVSILFFVWGFSFGLLNYLNRQIVMAADADINHYQGLVSAYFGGYLIGPLTLGFYVFRRYGFKLTFILGLIVYAVGVITIWPSAITAAYVGFIITVLVSGSGLGILEQAANPFLILCGAPKYGVIRLLLAQSVHGVAAIVSQSLAQKVLFTSPTTDPTLLDVQWAYLIIFFIMAVLVVFFWYLPLPEATEDDLQKKANAIQQTYNPPKYFERHHISIMTVTCVLGVASQFFTTGAQEAFSTAYNSLFSEYSGFGKESLSMSVFSFNLLGNGLYAAGRVIAAFLALYIPPRILLLSSYIGSIILVCLISAANVNTAALSAFTVLMWAFLGVQSPLTFALTVQSSGRHAKTVSSFLAAAIVGSSMVSWIPLQLMNVYGFEPRTSVFPIAISLAIAAIYPAYLCFVPSARQWVDVFSDFRPERYTRERVSSTDENGHMWHEEKERPAQP